MRIRSLDIHGFKSFPDKTRLVFGSGIGCVVGPNGCGKSNLVDAIKWCVGEQSAKSLRGEDMADVIFGGSTDRSAVGFAEVTLTFSAEGGDPFPGVYARLVEMAVTRRLFRDGRSEYLLNGERVRRRDVIDLFLDTGVGSNLYSFIEQGRIGEIIHASPEKRRLLVDEAAGISRYKARRDETQHELESTAAQLDRVADVSEEMAGRLRILEGQVARAARFRRLRTAIRQDETLLGLVKYADLAYERKEARVRAMAAQQEAAVAERELARKTADVEARRAVVEQVEADANAARDVLAGVEAELLASERERDALLRRVEDLSREVARAEHDCAEAGIAVIRGRDEVGAADAERVLAAANVVTAEDAVANRRAAHAAMRKNRDERRSEALETDGLAARSEAVWAAERVRVEESERRVLAVPAERERLAVLLSAARRELESLLDRRKKLRREAELRKAELERAQSAVASAQETATAARAEAETDRSRFAEVEAEVGAVRRATEEAERGAAAVLTSAERAGVEAISRAEREVALALAAADSDAARVVTAARDAASESSVSVEARLRQWLEAMQGAATVAERARDLRHREALASADAEDVRGARALEEAVRKDAAAATEVVVAEHALLVGKASQALEAASKAEQQAAVEAAAADAARAKAFRAQEAAVARREALAAAVGVDEAADRGTAAVREALGTTTVADVLEVAAHDEGWVSAALGDRLLAPVIGEIAQLRKAAGIATANGRATVVFGPPHTLERLLDAAIVDDLEAALRHHQATGGAAVVRGTGAVIERGGTIRLGPPSGDVLARRRALGPAAVDVEVASANKVATEASARDAVASHVAAKRAAEAALATFRAAERAAVEAERAVRTAGDAEGRRRVDADRTRRRASRDARLAAARSEGEAASALARESLAKAREEGSRFASVERKRAEAMFASIQSRAGEQQVEARAALAEGLAKVRSDARQREGEARTRLSAVRSSGAVAIEALGARVDDLRAQSARSSRSAAELEAAVQAARATQFTAEVAMARAAGDLQGSEAAEERLRARIVELQVTVEAHERAAEQASADAATAREALGLVTSDRDRARAVAAQHRVAALEAEAQDEAAASLVSTAEVAHAGCVAAATAALVRVETARRVVTDLAERNDRAVERARAITEERVREAELRQQRDAAVEAIRARRVVDAQAHDVAKQVVTTARRAVREAEAAIATATLRRDSTTRDAAEQSGKAAEFQREIEALCARLDERYQVSLPGLLDRVDAQGRVLIAGDDTGPIEVAGERIEPVGGLVVTPAMLDDVELVRERVAAIEDSRAMLRDLGEVNLGAFDEYREVAQRHAELSAQRADLEASVATIREAIARLNTTCRERFREAFDRVNANFQVTYPRLVGGGSARLSLTDEEDLLEAGVDIFVQPPGKRLQNLALLSGGEKAMAAISLLIALFQVRPSPFCLLDEVDAPLDEANGRRFNDMLREMSGTTQFIVISHNRKTMEAADVLYGITMPTPGVSRLVAVRLGA